MTSASYSAVLGDGTTLRVGMDQGVIAEKGSPEKMFTAPEKPRTREFLARYLG